MFEAGHGRKQIAQALNIHYGTVCRWIRTYIQQSEAGIQLGKRDRRSCEDRLLSPAQEAKLQAIIYDKCPDQLKLPFALWSQPTIKVLVWDLWGARIATRTIGTDLARWGFTPQKPAKLAYKQRSKPELRLETGHPCFLTRHG